MPQKLVFCSLRDIGCCNYCCVRFSSDADGANYEQIDQYICEFILKENKEENEEIIKKTKENPCIVCLGILNSNFFESILQNEELVPLINYEVNGFGIAISLPPNVLLRDSAVKIYIEENFAAYFNDYKHKFVTVSKAFNLAVKRQLEKLLQKRFDHQSGFQIIFNIDSEDCKMDIEPMEKIYPAGRTEKIKNKMKKSKQKSYYPSDYSKNYLKNYLENCNSSEYKKHFPVPPQIPNNSACLKSIYVTYENLYICGRYCKYSRNVGQTPWPFNDVNVETSVQEIIFDGLHQAFGFKPEKLTFSSGGREDLDVRCLGRGRPFYIKVKDSFKVKFTFDEMRNLETVINKSPYISVFDLDLCKNEDKKIIKSAEEKKKKSYTALCIVESKNEIDVLVNKINEMGKEKIIIIQKTPIRVAHRRPILPRKKCIYQMIAKKLPTHVPGHEKLIEVTLVTHAGTYVKEFIHGDLERTSPSLSEILNTNIDLIKLDVIGIHSKWPNIINSVQHSDINEEIIESLGTFNFSDEEDMV